MVPGAWTLFSFGGMYLAGKCGIHISSNTAGMIILTWLAAAPMALITSILGIIVYIRMWDTGRAAKILTLLHVLFLATAGFLTIAMKNFRGFGGQ